MPRNPKVLRDFTDGVPLGYAESGNTICVGGLCH